MVEGRRILPTLPERVRQRADRGSANLQLEIVPGRSRAVALRKVDRLIQTRVSRNVNEEMEESLPTLQRLADWIAWFSGSMPFLILNGLWFAVWIGMNVFGPEHMQFDPFPFGLLTMIVSLEAIFLSCFVLISQSRQAAKDKIRGDIEYEVNINAELEITQLHHKVDDIYEKLTTRFGELERLLKNNGRQ